MLLSQLNTEDAFEFYRSFIEWYCARRPQTSYLEIGCNEGWLTARIAKTATLAVGVDIVDYSDTWTKHREVNPETLVFEHSSSDDFFKKANGKFDCIFLDGSHQLDQVFRDINNAQNHLTEDGIIIVHDTFPPDKEHTSPNLCGNAYRAIEELEADISIGNITGLQIFTFPVRFGLTLISPRPILPW